MTTTITSVAPAARRLRDAARTGVPCEPVRDLIGATDVATAYAVQQQLTQVRLADGARVVGRKIGLTSTAVQEQLGVDQPDFGVLFDDMDMTGWPVPMSRLIQPKAEAEIAFVLGADLDGPLRADRWCCRVPSARWRPSAPATRSRRWSRSAGCRSAASPWCSTTRRATDDEDQGGRHRLRQHRDRPDDQGAPPLRIVDIALDLVSAGTA